MPLAERTRSGLAQLRRSGGCAKVPRVTALVRSSMTGERRPSLGRAAVPTAQGCPKVMRPRYGRPSPLSTKGGLLRCEPPPFTLRPPGTVASRISHCVRGPIELMRRWNLPLSWYARTAVLTPQRPGVSTDRPPPGIISRGSPPDTFHLRRGIRVRSGLPRHTIHAASTVSTPSRGASQCS